MVRAPPHFHFADNCWTFSTLSLAGPCFNPAWYCTFTLWVPDTSLYYFLSRKTNNFWKDYHQKLPIWVGVVDLSRDSNTGPPASSSSWKIWRNVLLAIRYCNTFLEIIIKQWIKYEFWWVFYSGNIFLVHLYHEMLGPGVNMGSYPFPFGMRFSVVSMRNPIFLVARDQASIPGVNRVLSPKNLWKFFVCIWNSPRNTPFFSIV